MHIYIICLIYQLYISSKETTVEKHHQFSLNCFQENMSPSFSWIPETRRFCVYFRCNCTNRPNPRISLFDLICAILTINHCHFSQGLRQWFIHCHNITCWKLYNACGMPSGKGNITKPILQGLQDLMKSRTGFYNIIYMENISDNAQCALSCYCTSCRAWHSWFSSCL